MKQKNILFLTLYTFSLTGGIEKVCANLMAVLQKLKAQKVINQQVTYSMHDDKLEMDNYRAFNDNKIAFGLSVIKKGIQSELIILSHINLLIFARLIKTINPSKRIILLAHGIEIWRPLNRWKKKLLRNIEIWAVSNFTATQIQEIHQIPKANIKVLNNCLPEGFKFQEKIKPLALMEKYNIDVKQQIILTICRLSSKEQYKGYDLVLLALKDVITTKPNLRYFLVGKADETEQERIDALITAYGLQKHVICTGYVADQEIVMFYQLADIFAMPSKGEGFGLVFIEAVANGCQVLAGNTDGSTDALLNGELGLLVDPENTEEIYNGLIELLNKPLTKDKIELRQAKVKEHFGFERYCEKAEELLSLTLPRSRDRYPSRDGTQGA